MNCFPIEAIAGAQQRLNDHPVYGAVRTPEDLRVFMQHHAFSVWDFMSLLKYLQHALAPARFPWAPVGDPVVRRFINEIVLEEETDKGAPQKGETPEYISHFELYAHAMAEIGADPGAVHAFSDAAYTDGIDAAIALGVAPQPSATFTRTTFDFIDSGKPHVVAAAFALGREHIIPGMFRAFLDASAVSEDNAPCFHYYLKRHIHLDEDLHGPLSLRMVDAFIDDDATCCDEAVEAALGAIEARIAFWDGVLDALPSKLSLAG